MGGSRYDVGGCQVIFGASTNLRGPATKRRRWIYAVLVAALWLSTAAIFSMMDPVIPKLLQIREDRRNGFLVVCLYLYWKASGKCC